MKYAICNETFEGWQLQQVFEFCGRAGYEGVELAPFTVCDRVTDVDALSRARIRDGAAACGLEISGLHWLLAKTEGLHLTSPDASIRQATTLYLRKLIAFAADVGARHLVFGSPQQRNISEGIDPLTAWEWSRETFRQCGAAAQDQGVIFCLEALPESNIFRTIDDCILMVEEVGCSGFQTMLDVKSMASEPRPIAETVSRGIHLARYLHANDANLREPGSGDVDFVPIFRALRSGGYDGWLSIEVFDYSGGPEQIARRGLAYLREAEQRALHA